MRTIIPNNNPNLYAVDIGCNDAWNPNIAPKLGPNELIDRGFMWFDHHPIVAWVVDEDNDFIPLSVQMNPYKCVEKAHYDRTTGLYHTYQAEAMTRDEMILWCCAHLVREDLKK